MRLLLLSDVHANLEALESCLDAAPDYDRVANLGDVVGYGASPNQTVDLVRAANAISVRGNHDRCCCGLEDTTYFNPVAARAALWTLNELSDRNLEWLRELPQGPVVDLSLPEAEFVHGSPADEDIYVASPMGAGEALEGTSCRLTFFGHTHIQGAYALSRQSSRGRQAKSRPSAEVLAAEVLHSSTRVAVSRVRLDPAKKYMINPGSVGQPRDRDRRAAFALYDSDQQEVMFYRVPYDIAGAQMRILEAGLPKMLAFRLEEGR